ncbi:ankyrin [Karstenula rhodostoma CBS 690.94]|uniref:Ankyrin n=1 Tax=Karstenula rhodostoma CBS 690.94 TaxID=1392251 RepID=A0A9P4PVS3_9PLEO|nr:ankyrin [Karstenula rhodostoma CBS 690.94]
MTCALLDLPVEIFQPIIHDLVTEVGVVEAWKLRGVCRTFAVEISNEIFSHQPERVIRKVLDKKFIRKNIGVYLNNVMKTSAGATGALMHKTKHLLHYITELLGLNQQQERDECARRLFQGLTSRLEAGEIADLIWTDEGPHPSNYGSALWEMMLREITYNKVIQTLLKPITPQEQLAAAVSVGSCDTVDNLFQPTHLQPIITSTSRGHPHGKRYAEVSAGKPWAQSTIKNGNLLEIAAQQDDHEMIHTLVAAYARYKVNLHDDLAAAVAYTIREENVATLEILLGYWVQVQRTQVQRRRSRVHWLASAADKGSLAMIESILHTKGTHTEPMPRKEAEAIIRWGTPVVLRHYLTNGRIDPHKTWAKSTPLIIASRTNDCSIVRELLLAGADINGTAGDGSTALYCACTEGNDESADYLLRKGAVVDLEKWLEEIRRAALGWE